MNWLLTLIPTFEEDFRVPVLEPDYDLPRADINCLPRNEIQRYGY